MKLVYFVQHSLASFFEVLYCLNLCRGYDVEFIVFGKRVGGARNVRKSTTCLGKFKVATRVPGRDKAFLVLCHDRGSLCHDMVLWFQVVVMS